MATTTRAWELVHEQHTPVKQAARRLGVRVCELYELLEKEKAERDNATHRAVALLSAVVTPRVVPTVQDGDARARAEQLLDEGLATRAICERLGRTERWLASVRQTREVACTAMDAPNSRMEQARKQSIHTTASDQEDGQADVERQVHVSSSHVHGVKLPGRE
jgi:hypothetical protein